MEIKNNFEKIFYQEVSILEGHVKIDITSIVNDHVCIKIWLVDDKDKTLAIIGKEELRVKDSLTCSNMKAILEIAPKKQNDVLTNAL